MWICLTIIQTYVLYSQTRACVKLTCLTIIDAWLMACVELMCVWQPIDALVHTKKYITSKYMFPAACARGPLGLSECGRKCCCSWCVAVTATVRPHLLSTALHFGRFRAWLMFRVGSDCPNKSVRASYKNLATETNKHNNTKKHTFSTVL